MSVVLIVVIALVLVAIAVPLLFWLGRRGRGSMQLRLSGHSYGPGQVIDGMVQVEAKKDLGPGRVSVSLVCNEEWTDWDTNSDGHQTRRERSREVYRHEVDVMHNLTMGVGDRQVLPFTLPTPADRDQPDSGFGRFMESIGGMFRAGRDYRWYVESRYDMPGLDLKDRRGVNVHIDL